MAEQSSSAQSTKPTLVDTLEAACFSALILELNSAGRGQVVVATATSPSPNGITNGFLHHVRLVYRREPPAVLSHIKGALETIAYHVETSKFQ